MWDMLNKSGHTGMFDLVGSHQNQYDTTGHMCMPANADQDTEGHPSCLVTEAFGATTHGSAGCNLTNGNILTNDILAHPADVVLFHFATNDIWNGISTTTILSAYLRVIGVLRQANPNVVVMVAQIIPLSPSGCDASKCTTGANNLNSAIPAWAKTNSTSQSPIVVVDQWTGFDDATDTADGVHPNAGGSTKIATNWSKALESYYPVF